MGSLQNLKREANTIQMKSSKRIKRSTTVHREGNQHPKKTAWKVEAEDQGHKKDRRRTSSDEPCGGGIKER